MICDKHRVEVPVDGVCPRCLDEHAPIERAMSALAVQEGGAHYKDMAIQPAEYVHSNRIPYLEGSVIYYVSRWRSKGGIEDLKKARHTLDLLMELEGRKA